MIKVSNVVTKGDMVKITLLLVVATVCWVWVYKEYKKPIIPPEWDRELQPIESKTI